MDIHECQAILELFGNLSFRTSPLSIFENSLNHIVSEQGKLVLSYAELSQKRDTILKEYENSKATIFSSLFKFRLENFHSEMLRKILDKNTPEIGSAHYLQVFVKLLHKINPKIKDHFFSDVVSIECEVGKTKQDGRIDIFIQDSKYAIIIENKINGAPDQPNQLARYLKYAKDNGKEVIAIVYLPLFKNTSPPIEGYAKEFDTYIPEIREKLIILPVIDNMHPDMVHGFLEPCLQFDGNNERQTYILSQYMKLLQSLKGEAKMTEDIDMEFLRECYKNKKCITIVENINDVWTKREYLLGGLLRETVRNRLITELGFVIDSEDENGLYKQINNKFILCFYSTPDDNLFYIGFWSDSEIDESLRKALEKSLNPVTPEK
ncbi:MAG: PD-(D/E)XK nuclease family protein [Treponema sp.]|jgi:hypothetical protein|nr:PD-(D/E)XK nuclease family protein [Treponema sp.]